ncbi:hypothetical protein C9374_010044 [Naegleria lovaniensis]|uniref:FGFR1 oncogene partner (FOP) N-terminal dimerisation domain-containing protein n=1 Tax=Naegleria lovaniensis TaxID=51637 RepID=A0AA88GGI2_NAELO|nr:uncharacterized protein C9374_010044 [Naegleria lovaniensis]KAG2375040.1 hypothetical protein C9374_010044 [Naegleria lovaniensis]
MASALLSNNNNNPQQLLELKEVVSQSLTCAGVIGRYKAQLRASVYDVLHGRPRGGEVYFQNQKIQQIKNNSENHLLSQLILEYFDFYDLKFTKSVLLPEANLEQENRENVLEQLENSSKNCVTELGNQEPLLLQLFSQWLHSSRMTTTETIVSEPVQQPQPPFEEKSPSPQQPATNVSKPSNNFVAVENKTTLNQTTQPLTTTKEFVANTVSPSLSLDDSFEEEQLSSTMKKRTKKSKVNNASPSLDGSKESSPSESSLSDLPSLSQKLPPLKPLVGLKTRDSSPPLGSGVTGGNNTNMLGSLSNNSSAAITIEKKHSPKESTFLTRAFDDSELDISDIEPSPKSERSNHSQYSNQSPKSNHSQLSTHSVHSTHSQKSNHSITHSEHLSEKSVHSTTHSVHSHKSNTSEKSNRSAGGSGSTGEKSSHHHHDDDRTFQISDPHQDDNVYNFDEDFGDIDGNYAEDGDEFGEENFDDVDHHDELHHPVVDHQNDEEVSGFSGSEFNDNYSDDFKDYESNPSNQSNHSLNDFSDHTAHSENFDDVENVLEDSF